MDNRKDGQGALQIAPAEKSDKKCPDWLTKLGWRDSPPTGGLLFVLSGPSGSGKDSLLKKLRKSGFSLHYTVTYTTRNPRKGEVHGVDYNFISWSEFEKLIDQNELFEHTTYADNYYGVPRDQVTEALRAGKDVLLRIETNGARAIRELFPNSVLIFVGPSSFDELIKRLEDRETDTPESIAKRLNTAKDELAAASEYDYIIINGNGQIDYAAESLKKIIDSERLRVKYHLPRSDK